MPIGASRLKAARLPRRGRVATSRGWAITLFAISFAGLVFAYYVVADRTTPFTGSARVQAFVIRMAPEVAGQVLNVDVVDNSRVDRGDTLFSLDPTPFNIAVEQAQAKLAQVGQTIGASTAAVDSAQAMLDEARAAEANVRAQTARTFDSSSAASTPRRAKTRRPPPWTRRVPASFALRRNSPARANSSDRKARTTPRSRRRSPLSTRRVLTCRKRR